MYQQPLSRLPLECMLDVYVYRAQLYMYRSTFSRLCIALWIGLGCSGLGAGHAYSRLGDPMLHQIRTASYRCLGSLQLQLMLGLQEFTWTS